MNNKKQFFENLINLLNENDAKIIVKMDGKNNSYIGFCFPDSTYCCTTIDELNPKEKIFIECEEKYQIEKNSIKEFNVTNDDHFSYNR